ncbi:MAG TPA: hypothetical protein VKA63_02305, partial [Candidatus Krumholzibacteria bacterium]|nr:hypothetical protein [Candidatus Krumholzibacteria bacterium]
MGILDDPGVVGAGSQYDAAGNPIDDQFSAFNHDRKNRVSVSTQTKLNNSIRMDLSYSRDWDTQSSNLQSGRKNTSREWPVVTLKIQNVHQWRIFGESMSNSSIDLTYRSTQSTTGVTAVNAGTPRRTKSIQPRWNVRFKNDVAANMNVNVTEDVTQSAGKDNVSKRIGVNMQFSKNFDANGALKFLRFGKQGTGSTIDMTIDLAFDQRSSLRKLENNREDQVSGSRSYSVRPRFNYQFSRALNAGMTLGFTKSKDLGNTRNGSTSFSLGFNATFTF